jgi:PP-loop superfamily ATP-utilizing enzyme
VSRVIAWFSCGAASAVAAKVAIEKFGERVEVVYCDTMSAEHPDNPRFFMDVEKWLGVSIRRIASDKFASVDEVFEKRKYMAGPSGAICTVEMKKVPRFKFQRADDVHVFGFTADEPRRIERFAANNPEMALSWVLRDGGVTKSECYRRLTEAGVKLPDMYALGYHNNNCLGCVKATSPAYWAKVRQDFPEVFAKRAAQSRPSSAA